ncbi:diphthamide biosynthesis protein 2 [Mycotypha africana]|uniref:diphthamide biosynthesis protein 2 n=1 Tax=Mycotypha africana TaxID=64632 RepID=UPI002300DC01|nr:diphthamide biosynthesis protein 2 [Mycotypha africana]KAI8979525.1 diphthamide biosynthesis protein 2 [Mycotypha africana]
MGAPAANGPTAFSDDGRAVIERQLHTHSEKHDDISELYELERTVAAIKDGAYKRIALQFPDELLADSAAVSEELAKRTGQNVFVLADTSYGSCCVDEVAADHVSADLIVHYGRSCLSPTSRIPVLYVFMQQRLDIDHCKDEFAKLFPDKDQAVIVMCDVEYSYAVEDLTAQLSKEYKHIIPTVIQTENNLQCTLPRNRTEGDDEEEQQKNASADNDEPVYTYGAEIQNLAPIEFADIEHLNSQKKKGGRYFVLPENVPIEDCSIFFIGKESLTLTNIMMVHNQCPVYTYNPKTKEARKESVQVNRMLMRRYFLVQKAKDANTFGIVVGTLGVASYLNIIEHVKKVIKAAGRKSYFFVMGKLNIEKMANFMEIDCFVLVACPENSLVDSKEFYRPIVTPFELELALISRGKEWTGDYETDFSKLLPQLRTDDFTYDEEREYDGSSDEEAHFSMVTGQYISRPLSYALRHKETDSSGEALTSKLTDLTLRNKETSISVLLNSTAGEYLKNRTFRGLEPHIGEDEAAAVQEGRSGIARGYVNEKKTEENPK